MNSGASTIRKVIDLRVYLRDEICAGVEIYFTGNNTTLNFRDPAATNSTHRFYRAVIP
jgi:hypothetical protein